MSYINQTEKNFNIIHVFTLEYYENSTSALCDVLKKMDNHMKEKKQNNPENYKKIMEGKREVDKDTLEVLAFSHNVCIEINQHPDPNVEQFYNTTANTSVYLNLKKYCSSSNPNVSLKRKRTEMEHSPKKVSKNTEQGGIKENQTEKIKKFISDISYKEAHKEIETFVFTNLKTYLHHNTIIATFQKAQKLDNVDKFKFYRELKNIYLKKLNFCWVSCEIEMLKISNSLKVQEHINRHMIAVESVLHTYLNNSLTVIFGKAMEKKKGVTENFSEQMEKISLNQVKKKLKILLKSYIGGFLDILSE
jgi:hypothetical protein